MRRDDRDFLVWSLAVIAVAAATPIVLYVAFGGSGDKSLAAVLALAGVIVTASASLIGYIVRRASERRLRLDAAMRAGTLLNDLDGRPPASGAVASGLLALTELDRADLAVALLVKLWDRPYFRGQKPAIDECFGDVEDTSVSEDRDYQDPAESLENPLDEERAAHLVNQVDAVPNEIAVLVIDAALRSSSANAQLLAAELLCRNSYRLDIRTAVDWPSAIDGQWLPHVGVRTKLLLVDALIRMALGSEKDEFALRSLAVRLYGISDGDPDEHVKGCLGVLIGAILPALEEADERAKRREEEEEANADGDSIPPADGPATLMQGPREVTLDDVRTAAGRAHRNPNRYMARVVQQRSKCLERWANACQVIDYRAGALAEAGGR